MLNQHPRIQKIIRLAQQGDVVAAFQIHEYFKKGKFVDIDLQIAEQYLNIALDNFKKQEVHLSSLSLLNFRGIERLTYQIKKNQVIIGNNGAGKTTILDAIYLCLSWLVQRIVHVGGKGKEIDMSDITVGNQDGYSSIIAELTLNDKLKSKIELCEAIAGSAVGKKSYYLEFNRLGALYKLACEKDIGFELPVFAYYGVMRSVDVSSRDFTEFDDTSNIDSSNRFDGYNGCLSGKADFKSFFRWYKRLDDQVKHQKSNSIDLDLNIVSELKNIDLSGNNSKQNLLDIINRVQEQQNQVSKSWALKAQEMLNNIIPSFMDGFSDLKVELNPYLHISIIKNGNKLNILQLSQGEKSLIALVFDISRRMMILNPHLDDPFKAHGIILIDELELHLHPKWQRNVLNSLNSIFPNCQFIISTHSPQVISEVKNDNILILERNNRGKLSYFSPKQSYGLTSNQILNELMDSEDIKLDRAPEIQERIDHIFKLIADHNLEDAKAEIEELEHDINGEIPELVSAKFDIDMFGWDEK